MRKVKPLFYCLLFYLSMASICSGQTSTYRWKGETRGEIKALDFLIDQGYTLDNLLTDSTLTFQPFEEGYKPIREKYWWIRFSIQNTTKEIQKGYMALIPEIENTFYYRCGDAWETMQAGLAIPKPARLKEFTQFSLAPKTKHTFYVKVKVEDLQEEAHTLTPHVVFYSKNYFEGKMQRVFFIWGATVLAMGLFFLYNLYIYFVFKDRAQIYYLVNVLGAMLYLTGFSQMFNFVLSSDFYSIQVQPTGALYSYQIEHILTMLFLGMALSGLIQFTRSYLQLALHLPWWDRFLTYTLYFLWTAFSLISALSLVKEWHLYISVQTFLNLFSAFVVLSLLVVGGLYYKKNAKLATYFLMANSLPLIIAFVLAAYLMFNKVAAGLVSFLPHLALLVQALTFAVALVARINLIKDEIKEKELYAEKLKRENEAITSRNQYIELENECIMAEMAQEVSQKHTLKQKLEANQRELAANALYLYQKNEMLVSLRDQIKKLSYKDTSEETRKELKEIKSTLKNDLYLENDWEKFKVHFESVHPDFFKDLKEKYPDLTPNEVRLSAYLHLNMSAKEIATLLNINPTSVHRAKSRLMKKKRKADEERGVNTHPGNR